MLCKKTLYTFWCKSLNSAGHILLSQPSNPIRSARWACYLHYRIWFESDYPWPWRWKWCSCRPQDHSKLFDRSCDWRRKWQASWYATNRRTQFDHPDAQTRHLEFVFVGCTSLHRHRRKSKGNLMYVSWRSSGCSPPALGHSRHGRRSKSVGWAGKIQIRNSITALASHKQRGQWLERTSAA